MISLHLRILPGLRIALNSMDVDSRFYPRETSGSDSETPRLWLTRMWCAQQQKSQGSPSLRIAKASINITVGFRRLVSLS